MGGEPFYPHRDTQTSEADLAQAVERLEYFVVMGVTPGYPLQFFLLFRKPFNRAMN